MGTIDAPTHRNKCRRTNGKYQCFVVLLSTSYEYLVQEFVVKGFIINSYYISLGLNLECNIVKIREANIFKLLYKLLCALAGVQDSRYILLYNFHVKLQNGGQFILFMNPFMSVG